MALPFSLCHAYSLLSLPATLVSLQISLRTSTLQVFSIHPSHRLPRYGHGLSHRLIEGGGENCLTTLEARGLGEGWSDALAEWTLTKSAKVEDWVFGACKSCSKVVAFLTAKRGWQSDTRIQNQT